VQDRPVIVVFGRYRPHELLFLLLSILWGASALFTEPEPDDLVNRLPTWLTLSAAGLLLISGTFGLVGCTWRRTVEVGLGLELGAMLIGVGGLLLSGYAFLRYGNGEAAMSTGFVAIWIVANLWRALQIRHDLGNLRRKDG